MRGRFLQYSLNDQKSFIEVKGRQDSLNLKEDALPGEDKHGGNTRTHIEHER